MVEEMDERWSRRWTSDVPGDGRTKKTKKNIDKTWDDEGRRRTWRRLSQQQIAELLSQVEDLQKALQEQDSKSEDSSLLKKKLEEHLEKLHEAHSDLQKKREVIDDLEPGVDSNNQNFEEREINLSHLCVSVAKKIDELQTILRKKDEDMRQMEERYKRYMEKART
ncbi:protein Hook homolog 2 isoform X2, partial [Tachysurus ichikawai]